MAFAGQLLDRRLSSLSASTSESQASRQVYSASFTVHYWQRWHKKALKEQNKLHRTLCALAASDASDEYSGWGVPEAEWAKSNPSRQQSTAGRSRAVFSDYDYSVYQQMSNEQITEDCLWDGLAPFLEYLPDGEIFQVRQALRFASRAHAGQSRKSGEPFITHPVEVTRILAELNMDRDSLIAGILHDTVEDNPDSISFEEIGFLFGDDVRTIVEGETKFSKIGQLSANEGKSVDVKARDLQHLFLAMTKEVRIIVVKLADRLHNMRTLGSLAKHKQRKIADETLQVFAPLARLLGLYGIKEELEELGFRYSKPDEYATLRRHLDHLSQEYEPVVQKAQRSLEELLNGDDYLRQRADRVHVTVSQKSVYSLHRKLEETASSASDITCVSQLCVVIPQKTDQNPLLYGTGSQLCYHVMGLVHTMWAPVPGSIKDYIATPKRNGYRTAPPPEAALDLQSLHTTVLPLGSTPLVPLEVLIRTCKMQELAEFGIVGETWGACNSGRSSMKLEPQPSPQSIATFTPTSSDKPKMMVGDLLRLLPKLVGLNSDLMTGNALLTVNGTVLQAPRLGVNGYRASSIHSSVVAKAALLSSGHSGPTMETWKKKSTPSSLPKLDRDVMKRREHWLKSIIEWQQEFMHSLSAREFVDGITGDLLGRSVFVFTPSGDLLRLPKDSTTVDFAYHVHTDVGNQMVGAKVNGKLVNPEHLLQNAEVIEVLTYDGPPTALAVSRHYEWAKFIKSRTARHKLAKYLKDNWELLPEQLRKADQISGSTIRTESLERGQPSSSALAGLTEKIVWLDLNGADRPSLLADVAQIMGKHGHHVRTFNQRLDSKSGASQMQFEVQGVAGQCQAMCEELSSFPFIASCKVLDVKNDSIS